MKLVKELNWIWSQIGKKKNNQERLSQTKFFLKEITLDFEQFNSNLLPHQTDIDTRGETLQDKDLNRGKDPTVELQVYTRKKLLLSRVHPCHALDQPQLPRLDSDLHYGPLGKTVDTNLSLPTTSIPKPANPEPAKTYLDIPMAIRKGVRTCSQILVIL